MKKCIGCGLEKDYSLFYISGEYVTGENKYSSRCKICYNEQTRLNYKNHPEEKKTYRKKYQEENRNKLILKGEKYRAENRDLIASRRRANINKKIFADARWRAKQNNLEFSIDLSDVIIPNKCPVIGVDLFSSIGQPTINSPSLDRIDNSRGYIKDNVIVVSFRVNTIKRDSSIEDLDRVATYYENLQKM